VAENLVHWAATHWSRHRGSVKPTAELQWILMLAGAEWLNIADPPSEDWNVGMSKIRLRRTGLSGLGFIFIRMALISI